MTVSSGDRKRNAHEDARIGVGIIGTGMWSHYSAIACNTNPHSEIVGLADINEASAKKHSKRYGLDVPIFSDYRELLALDALDAVIIATPNYLHAPMSIASIEAGKHTLCEKPMSSNFADAEAMVAAAEKSTVRTMIGYTNRFYKGTRFLYDFLRREDLGRVYHVRAFWLQSWLSNPNTPAVWRLEKEKTGTGVLGDLGGHITDLAQYLLGDTITRVTGMMKTFTKQRPTVADPKKMQTVDVDDAVMFGAEFKNGAMGVFEASRNGTGRPDHWRIEIGAEQGTVSFDSVDERVQFSTISGPVRHANRIELSTPLRYGDSRSDTRLEAYQKEVDHFVECIRSEETPSPSFAEALKTERVLDAVVRSSLTGTAVNVEG